MLAVTYYTKRSSYEIVAIIIVLSTAWNGYGYIWVWIYRFSLIVFQFETAFVWMLLFSFLIVWNANKESIVCYKTIFWFVSGFRFQCRFTERSERSKKMKNLELSKYCLRAFKQYVERKILSVRVNLLLQNGISRWALALFALCDSTRAQYHVLGAMQRLVDRFYFWFCFVSATNYNLFDRNSAKYKNINNDIMCFFVVLLVSWDRCIFPLFVRVFSVSKPFFSILLFNLYRCAVADAQSNESHRIECKCNVWIWARKTCRKTANEVKNYRFNFLPALMSRWVGFFLSRFQNALVYTNKKLYVHTSK